MAEFGHNYGRIPGFGRWDSWGAGPFVLEHKGKSWRFEDSDQFGPSLVRKDGEVASRQPGEKSLFWALHRAWVRCGRKVDGDRCVFWLPKEKEADGGR